MKAIRVHEFGGPENMVHEDAPDPAPGEGEAYLGSLLRQCRAMGASDLHISVGLPPIIRLSGGIVRAEHEELTAEQTEAWLSEILPEEAMSRFREDRELDFAYTPDVTERYRANAFFDRHGMAASCRIVMERIPTLAELGLPAELSKLTDFRQGPGAHHRPGRLREVHHPRGADRHSQSFPQGTYHHHRRPGRVHPSQRSSARESPPGRSEHQLVLRRAPCRAA